MISENKSKDKVKEIIKYGIFGREKGRVSRQREASGGLFRKQTSFVVMYLLSLSCFCQLITNSFQRGRDLLLFSTESSNFRVSLFSPERKRRKNDNARKREGVLMYTYRSELFIFKI